MVELRKGSARSPLAGRVALVLHCVLHSHTNILHTLMKVLVPADDYWCEYISTVCLPFFFFLQIHAAMSI